MGGQVLEEIIRTGTVRTSEGQELPLHSHIPPEEGALLQQIIRRSRPTVSLEIGLAYGVSAMYICEALRDVGAEVHVVLDPLQEVEWKGVGLRNLSLAGYAEMVRFEPEPSSRGLPRLLDEGLRVDFAFVDGSHRFDDTLVEFFYLDLLLRTGGIMAFDDAGMECIQKVLRFALTNRAYSLHAVQPTTFVLGPTRRAAWRALRTLGRSSRAARRIINPRYVLNDLDLGLEPNTRCIALRKDAPDDRPWHFYRDF